MNIYVGNLAWGVVDEELKTAFENYGQVTSATVIKDKVTGKSRGFGFVEMPDSAEAQAAINGLNGTDLKGRAITVNEARPAKPREGREGGRNRRMGSRGGSFNE